MTRRGLRGSVAVLWTATLWTAGCSTPPHPTHGAAAAPPVLFTDLGTYHRTIATGSPAAQAFFDQGLRLHYAFNHLEAERAFREAARLDATCAICYWGIALTQGSNYNSPTDAERERVALEAVQAARALSERASPAERALIEALVRRHGAPGADRAALDRAYADAMRDVVRRVPDDPDAGTLLADALMVLRPWNLWQPDGTPQPETLEIVQVLDQVLARSAQHPGALHLYIHAVEAGPRPGQGEGAADRLRGLVPGAGHLVHMPSHIYLRVGRYADAHTVNIQAADADRSYFRRRAPSDIYRMGYYPHNLDFAWLAASMEGRGAETVRAARAFAGAVPLEVVRHMSDMETAPAAPYFALARFGGWAQLLAEPAPSADLPYVQGAWRYTRGLALAATGRAAEADGDLAALRALAAAVPAERTVAGYFKTRDLLTLAGDVLAGELAARRGRTDEAVSHLLRAVAAQDGHWFTEPPPWYFPVRQALGAVLLAGGRPIEAEAVYREDLRRNPDNGWSLYGLAESLRAQGKASEAAAVTAHFRRAWALADVVLTASRF